MKMMKNISTLIVLMILVNIKALGQTGSDFEKIYRLIGQKGYFEADLRYAENQKTLTPLQQSVIECHLDNAFGRVAESGRRIDDIIVSQKAALPDSIIRDLYALQADNAIKSYDYKVAKNSTAYILDHYSHLLDSTDLADYRNSLTLWSALEDQSKQTVEIAGSSRIKIIKDMAGLKTLEVHNATDTCDFVFDTGANLSTTSASVARQMNMTLLPSKIEAATITADKVEAQLAICPKLSLGHIDIYNAVFLVLDDSALSFPEIGYQIYGIIGFPVIEALREIQITADGYFIVPDKETDFDGKSNMAMDELTPLIAIDNKPYAMDTGADKTMLYTPYYLDNKASIDSAYTKTTARFGGAAGGMECEAYEIDVTLRVLDKTAALTKVSLITDNSKLKRKTYGNIGQDLISQFDKMTLNFNKMFIKFD